MTVRNHEIQHPFGVVKTKGVKIKNFEEGKLKIIEAIRSTLKDEFDHYFFEEKYPNLK